MKLYLYILAAVAILSVSPVVNGLNNDQKSSLFIDSLRTADIPEGKITIVRKTKDTKFYSSYIASYRSEDNLKLYTLLNVPHIKDKNKKLPVIIINHGYIPPHIYSTEHSYKLVTGYFASYGFIVLKPDYRGHADSEKGSTPEPFNRIKYAVDVLYLLKTLGSVENADLDNVFMYGHSMGGDVTLRVLETTGLIKAATLWAPVAADFPESTLYFVRKKRPQFEKEIADRVSSIYNEDELKGLSPIDNLEYIRAPLLIHHGTLDDSVPFKWSLDLIKKLESYGKKYTFHEYTDDHNFAKTYFYTVLKRDVDFFKSYITGNK